MIERIVVEYLANAGWQIPLLAGGAWLLLRAANAGPDAQHRVWLVVLALAIGLPLHGMTSGNAVEARSHPVAASPREQSPAAMKSSRMDAYPAAPATGARWLEAAARPRRLVLPLAAAGWIVRLYAGVMFFGLCRVLWAWHEVRRLIEESREISLAGEHTVVLEDYGRSLRIRLPELRESVEIASPMVVGSAAPVLLLPERFAAHDRDAIRAALLHELAHVRRKDYLVNAVCQIAALPVVWHPATHWVHARICRTREMICDRMAAGEMRSKLGYAHALLRLAEEMLDGREFAAGVGLFSNNVLEERIMRLTETTTTMRARTRMVRLVGGTTAMAATTAIAILFHLTPAIAQQSSVAASQRAPTATTQQTSASATSTSAGPQTEEKTTTAHATKSATAAAREPRRQQKKQQADKAKNIYANGGIDGAESYALVDGVHRPLTPEEKAKLHEDLARAQKEIAETQAKIQSPEFRRQIADAQAQAAKARDLVNSPEFKKQIADAQAQAAKARDFVNSPEFKRQIADAEAQAAKAHDYINSPEFKRQIDEMRKTSDHTMDLQMAKMQDEIQKATAKLDSAEFRKQMEEIQKIDMAPVQRQLEESMKTLNREMNANSGIN